MMSSSIVMAIEGASYQRETIRISPLVKSSIANNWSFYKCCFHENAHLAQPVVTSLEMSERKPSRGDCVTRLPIKTMADVKRVITADSVLGQRQKEAQRSAVNNCCKWLGKEPEHVSAEFRALQRELARLTPALCNVSKGRFANVKSLLNRTMLALRADLIDTRKIAPQCPSDLAGPRRGQY